MIPETQKALSMTKRIFNRKNHELEKNLCDQNIPILKIPKPKNNFQTQRKLFIKKDLIEK